MARNYKNKSIVSGLTVNDILNLDIETFNKLGVSDMKKVVGRLVSAGNKRLRNFESRGEESQATRYIERTGGKFSTKNKDLNALRAEYVRAKNFFESQTGSISGWTKVKKETISSLKKQGVDVSPEQFSKMWKAYEELKELSPDVANRRLKYAILNEVSNMLDNSMSVNEIVNILQNQIEEIYEQRAEFEDANGVSEFFE